MMRLVIATRRSRLALWQAGHVKRLLEERHADLAVDLLPMTTRGDELVDRRLDQAGGKGLFVKELETAMQEGRADLAVHSMKDVPAELPPGFILAAITSREDPRDAFISTQYKKLEEMPAGASVGTSSLRRECQLRRAFPRLPQPQWTQVIAEKRATIACTRRVSKGCASSSTARTAAAATWRRRCCCTSAPWSCTRAPATMGSPTCAPRPSRRRSTVSS